MNQQSTLAFGASAIQAGAQGQQAARFLGSLGETLAELTMEANAITKKHHRSEKDRLFMSLPGQLGYGSYGEIEQKLKKDPNKGVFDLISSFQKIKQPLDRQKAMSAMFGADFGRFLANMIASPEMLKRTKQLAEEAAGQKEGNDFISEAWSEYSKSLEFLMDRISATWKVLKTELGGTFKPLVDQLSQYVTDWYNAVKTGGLKEKLTAVLNGLTEGFLGKPGTFRDLLESMFGKPGDGSLGKTDAWFKFARGFAAGLREVGEMISSVMSKLATYFGGSGDTESMGKFTAQIIALVGALVVLGPVISIMASFVTLVGALAAIFGTPALAAGVATALQNSGVKKSRIREKGESYEHWQNRIAEDKAARVQKQSGSGFNPADVHPMNYLGEKLDKFGGKIERASLMSTDFSAMRRGGGLGYAYEGAGSSLAGGGGGSGMRLLSGVGTPDALIKNVTPGGSLPNFGVGTGGIIGRGGKVDMGYSAARAATSGSQEAASAAVSGPADGVGAGLGGSAFLAARRARFAQELKDDPTLRMHLAAMQATEGASRGGTIESLMNRADMQGKTMRQMLGYSADGQINPRSFYGPIRRGELGPTIARLKRNPKEFAQYDALTNRALGGSHIIGGYTDQGLPTDPNGSKRTGIPGLVLRDPRTGKKDGNEFTDWVGPGSAYGKGRQGAINYRRFIEQHINDVPSPADAIKNVPAAAPQSGVPMRGDFGGNGRGSVAIHINGNSHDPEALATLVQRRVDEQMNWRTHDTDSEYT
ncbi:hypothetical protein QIH80_22905 [Bradyrhizobium elkanii]|nr:hypothetical protein QIH80_22905 [Bradyrhizobium elkanii]